ncbi:MAG: M23 family metallopeptidase [Gemmatimonadales bacterium]
MRSFEDSNHLDSAIAEALDEPVAAADGRLMRTAAALAVLWLGTVPLAARQIGVHYQPEQPYQGSFFRIRVTTSFHVADVRGRLFGEALHFERLDSDWSALAGIPVAAEGDVDFVLVTVDDDGQTTSHPVTVFVRRARYGADTLTVASRFSASLDSRTQARVARERQRTRDITPETHNMPRLWRNAFILPTSGPTTSGFGRARVFNGEVTSRHLGVDLDGEVGDPVRAANDGLVVLVGNFFYSGNTVYLSHGAGLITSYFHLNEIAVQEGEQLRRGQILGWVGQTGRVTGPHLHWSARYGGFSVNPLSLLSDLGFTGDPDYSNGTD